MAKFILGALGASLLLLIGANPALAVDEVEYGKEIFAIVINGDTGGVAVKEPETSQSCLYTLIRFDYTTPLGRAFYAAVLAAKASGDPVNLRYRRDGQSCTLLQVNAQ